MTVNSVVAFDPGAAATVPIFSELLKILTFFIGFVLQLLLNNYIIHVR